MFSLAGISQRAILIPYSASKRREKLDPEKRERLPEHFPEKLLEAASAIEGVYAGGVAWKYEDAMKAIHAIADAHYAILGGDVYRKEHDKLVSTYDSWYLNQQALSWEEYVEESRKKALSYIEMYDRRNGKMYYYAPVTAEEGWKKHRMTSSS